MYEGDSFFTLTPLGRAGLLILSAALFASLCGLIWAIRRKVSRARSLVAALVVSYLFVWLSPQIYYSYYLTLFDGLPLQWVIQSPPGPTKLLRTATFTQAQNLSAHAQGLLFWALLLIALFGRRHQSVARDQ